MVTDGKDFSETQIGPWQVLAFLCELAMLAAYAVAGWAFGTSAPTRIGLAVALPTAAAMVWGLWLAPRARRRLRSVALISVKLAVFVLAGVVLAVAGHATAAVILVVVSVADLLVIAGKVGLDKL